MDDLLDMEAELQGIAANLETLVNDDGYQLGVADMMDALHAAARHINRIVEDLQKLEQIEITRTGVRVTL